MSQNIPLKLDKRTINATVGEVIGKDVLPLLHLVRKGEYSELLLADKLDAEVNSVRNILYRLHQHNLVKSERRRDDENGWYVYWWRFVPEGLNHLFRQLAQENILTLTNALQQESGGSFYTCQDKCVRLEFDDAFGMEFRCPECGDLMHLKEQDQQRIEELQIRIEALNGLIS